MTFSKVQLIARINQVTAINKYRISRDPDADGLAMDNELFAIALASLESEAVVCPKCNGTGMTDSGGVYPWGEGIVVPCDCTFPDPEISLLIHDLHIDGNHGLANVIHDLIEGKSKYSKIKNTAPPAPVSVPDEQNWEDLCQQNPEMPIADAIIRAASWNACHAAMLQGAENAESRCTIQAAPVLGSSPKNAELRGSNSPVIGEGRIDETI